MKKMNVTLFKLTFIFIFVLNFTIEQRINPEDYKEKDIIFAENDKLKTYEFRLIEAKVLTKEEITLYLKKQGIHLEYDDCCKNMVDYNAWNVMNTISDYKEIYSNAKYNKPSNKITYKFPVQKIENKGYKVYHKLWVINPQQESNVRLKVYFNYLDTSLGSEEIFSQNVGGTYFFDLEISCESIETTTTISYKNKVKTSTNTIDLKGEISTITFEYEGKNYSPAIALHWTYYRIDLANSNYSLKGNSLCDKVTNPCISGYFCVGGVCKKCHPSCFDCVNGALSTDCYSKCNPHSALITPNKGSCNIGYVDLNQFDDFYIEDIIPPPRNNRLTISFWMYLNSFPETPVTAYLNNSFNDDINYFFDFDVNKLTITCSGKNNVEISEDALNSWFYVKCAISYDHSNKNYLYLKYFNGLESKYQVKNTLYETEFFSTCKHDFKKYYEPDDYISLRFNYFNLVKNEKYACNIYMKQLVIFREFLPEPYDNKYFSIEKLFTSTLELPEVLFVIPFDELKKEGNKYKIKCYSYSENIEENEIIISPRETGEKFSLYPPKLFKRLNLLEKNQKYKSTDLLEIENININEDENILLASYDNVPLTCKDNFFLNFDSNSDESNPNTYNGECKKDCPTDTTMIFGLGDRKGFCNRKCEDNLNYKKCVNSGEELFLFQQNFECKDNYYNMFYQCEDTDMDKQIKEIFYYDPNYSPANIVIDVRHYNLKSYIIEFWFYLIDDKYKCGKGKVTSGYIFYTNQIKIRKVETSFNVYTTAHDIRDPPINIQKYWNHIAFEVYYDPREERNYKTRVYMLMNYDTGNPYMIDNSENPYPLDYIYFCNGRRASCNNIEIDWYCGYYKNLRLFNGNMAQRHVIFRYDEYYSEYKYLLSSIIFYYPLYGHYISNNNLTQYRNKLSPLVTTSSTNNWNYPQYNYCIRENNVCTNTSCKECLDANHCFLCNNVNNMVRVKGGEKYECNNENKFVLKLPMDDVEFEINSFNTDKYTGITVNFFIKLYGFKTSDKIDIMYLGDNLKLSYNSNLDDLYFGLNLVSFTGSLENVISNYYDFRKHFGLWTFISVATYNKTNENFFPPMVRFEINHKKMPIVGPLDYLNIEKISFSNQIFALIQRVKVYSTYIIGAHSFETNKGNINTIKKNIEDDLKRPTNDEKSYFVPSSKDDCRFSKYNIRANKNGASIDEYECVSENDLELLNFDNNNLAKFYPFYNESRKKEVENCYNDGNEICDICIGNTQYNCSCNFKNNEEKIFLGNVSNHYCRILDYINFAKAKEFKVNIGKLAANKFTLHFWVFAYSYVENVFEGLEVEWENHVTVKVFLDSTKRYNFNCVINGNPASKSIDFIMNEWNFLHCAVNYDEKKLYMTTEEDSYELDYIEDKPSGIDNVNSILYIRDLTNESDWGILFYKDIRLWNDAYQYSSFLSRIKITKNYFKTNLLYQLNTTFNKELRDHKVIIEQKDPPSNNFVIVEYDTNKIGTNIVPEEIYEKVLDLDPKLCNDTGQYYDRKTYECITFLDISSIDKNITIEQVDVAFSHNYGMAFWILMEDHENIEIPLNFIWQYHMQISLQYNKEKRTFYSYCFPQNYFPYSTIIGDTNLSLEERTKQVLNSATNAYTEDLGGKWTWIECSLTYNNRYFYLNDNQQPLIAETLYNYGNVESLNDEPLGYFFNGISETRSTLKIEILGNQNTNGVHKKLYLRCFYLFKDYLPYTYNFKYMDMSLIDKEQFPPLTLAIDFASFPQKKEALPDKVTFTAKKYSSLENLITPDPLYFEYNCDDRQLSANFVFLPLCNPLTKEKYDSENRLCQEIENCDTTALNCLYCMDENTPLVCKTNYYINIDTTKDSVECLNYCKGNYYRSPGTLPSQGICGTDCISLDILLTCPNTAASILTYQKDFTCKTGYTRIGYQCFNGFDSENPGALFYSGINYPYNIYQSFTNDFITLIAKGYVLEFWFMIDNVIYNKTLFEVNEKYYYFNAKPHEIYVKKDNSNKLLYNYLFDPGDGTLDYEKDLTNLIHQYEWNKILIFADATISGIKQIRVVVNFDKENTILFDITKGDLTLTFIAFCSKDPDLLFPECVSRGKNISWASAYYNNIRIWNIETSTIDTIQSYINGIYTEYPQSIMLFYPLTINYLDNNKMVNIMVNLEEHITFKCESVARCALYNKDNIIIYNYSSKFDWGLLNDKHFVLEMNGDFTRTITPGECNEHCIRCFEENNIKQCYECETGYVLQYKECKNATQYYFLKTPSASSGTSINLILENDNGLDFTDLPSFTIVFWIKFFGVLYPTVTEYCRILTLDSNTYLAFQRSTNDLVVLENSKIVFRDTNFQKYFGIWIPISIANYISNAQSEIYPNMFTLSVNRIDIPFTEGYSLPSTGIKVTQLQLGYEIIALFAELSIYSKFIQGGYGKIRSTNDLIKEDRYYYKNLTAINSTTDCVSPDDLIGEVSIICSPDYSINFMEEYFCNNTLKFYEPYNSENNENNEDDRCKDCDQLCNTLCFSGGEEECTCDMTDGIFWLRRNKIMQTYCEHIPYLDFGNIKPYTFTNAPMSKTKEYTIEFWLFVYSYNTKVMNFKTLWIEWNYHNRLKLYDEQNSLKVNCQPIWRSGDFDTIIYPDNKQGTLKYYQWNYVKCGTDYKNKKYFLNTITEYPLKAKEEYFFDLKEIDNTTTTELKYFSIYRSSDFYVNFGYVFIRELKLWQQYNLDFIDSTYKDFNIDILGVEQLKKSFPGLLLYFKNEFNLTENNNPIITEILTGQSIEMGRDPDYIGYNIVDPDNEGYAPLLVICPIGMVYNDLLLEKCQCPDNTTYNNETEYCDPVGDEEYELCKAYSNLEKKCYECKDDNVYLNKWLDEFEEKCYLNCPDSTYGDDLINQCRRCHETCKTCFNDEYTNCITCGDPLYFNFKENTCIPNCQTAGLTRSLTKPNICVIFDADASLVNVNTLTPIDTNTFDYIEALVIGATSSEYKTLWLFDANQTNILNRELGFDDDIPLTSTPFTGNLSNLKTDLDHNFFKYKHKYVFGLKIYVENNGLEVPIYVWWTLTMNAPPFGGRVTVMPYLGLYNTTTFIMRCVDFLDENTPEEELEYDFYYIEMNTNSKIKLSDDFSLNNEVYSNFTVRYYQLNYSNITIYCQVRDKYGAIEEASTVITIVNQKNSELYNLKQIVSTFTIVDDSLTDIQLLARAEVLMSLGINPYTERVPSSYYTTYQGSLTGEKVEMKDPLCITGYCNDNGDCEVIDIALTCKCVASYIGKECFLDKDGYTDLAYYYKKLYQKLIDRLILGNIANEPINDVIFTAFYRLFFAAQNFFQENSFFETNLIEFKSYLKEEVNYITENEDRINKLLDLDKFFFNYFYVKETQIKLSNKINENYPFRNKTLTISEYSSYQTAFQTFFNMIDEDTAFLIKKYGKDYDYTSPYFVYHLRKIDESFNDQSFFESLKTVYVTYKPIIFFMDCLKEKNKNFNYFFSYVEYLVNPLSYDAQYYPNITAPLISIKIYDLNGNEIPIRNCPSKTPIKIHLPFNSYDWMNYINEQKWLFLPENYKLEDDPIFRDPILIWDNGTISSDTAEERIAKYYRYYNIVGLVHTPSSLSLYEYTTFLFKNISDTFLLMFETNHLGSFSAMIIPNIMNFIVDGRFYYLPRYKVLLCLQNQIHNAAFYIWASLLFLFICTSLVFYCYDYDYFDKLEQLDFLLKEIIKVHFPYKQLDPGLNDENIFKLIPTESKLKKSKNRQIRRMFNEYDMGDIKENGEEEEEDEDKKESNLGTQNRDASTKRRLKSIHDTDSNEENEKEKATEIITHKRRKHNSRSSTRIKNKEQSKDKGKGKDKENPPKKHNHNKEDEDMEHNSQEKRSHRRRESSRNQENELNLNNNNKTSKENRSKSEKKRTERRKIEEDENVKEKEEKEEKGYGDNDEDFNENKIENFIKSEQRTLRSYSKGSKQNFDLQALDAKYGFNSSKFSKNSRRSKKAYFYDKEKTKSNLIALEKFHNKAGRINVDNDGIPLDIVNEVEERKKALEAFTRLSVSPKAFFIYNVKARHILIAPFINLTLFNNRWKKLMVLLTQLYIQQLIISLILTYKESITISNAFGMIVTSLISSIISDLLVYCFVFLFETSTYQRKRLYRLVMMGERMTVEKAWNRLKRTMNFSLFFGSIIAVIIWVLNLYVTLIFTAVWYTQRSAWVVTFILTLIMNLVIGELLIEGICAFSFSRRSQSEFYKKFGESLNRLRCYRTLWP